MPRIVSSPWQLLFLIPCLLVPRLLVLKHELPQGAILDRPNS